MHCNQVISELLDETADLLTKLGEPFRAKAYKTAANAVSIYSEMINSDTDLSSIKGVGKTTQEKIKEILKTGKLNYNEELKLRPQILFTNIYGVGPKKAKELANNGFVTIEDIEKEYENDSSLLNDKQAIGLKYYKDILERIPRDEIETFRDILNTTLTDELCIKFEIVGSYRRGASNSGDIDVILTTTDNSLSAQKQTNNFNKFLELLKNRKIITHFLSQGPTKSLVIGNVEGYNYYRRIDFLYTKPSEYPYAVLYFTGSKYFNLAMRGRALKQNMSLNEHCFSDVKTKNKIEFPNVTCEKDIFDILNMEYKEPQERVDGNSVVDKTEKVDVIFTLSDQQGMIQQFLAEGQTFLEKQSKDTLNSMIKTANHFYFNEQPILSDNEYDILKEYTEETFPDYVADIGAPVSQSGKVKLQYPMPSMNKKKDEKSIKQWFDKHPMIHENAFNYAISAKLDGVSAMFCNENGECKLYTRGDGISGQDISHMIPFMVQLQRITTKKITVRGELLITKELFEKKYTKKFRNRRNFVSGVVNQTKDLDSKESVKKYKDIDFICYEIITPAMTLQDQIALINAINGGTPLNIITFEKIPTIKELSEYLQNWRDDYRYEIDGIIVSYNTQMQNKKARENKNPEDAFAFKMALTDQTAETFVTDVIWTSSKDGYLKPRVQFQKVKIGGVDIEFATGFNGAYIKDNNINIGTKIEVIRSGDVIPYINSVITPSSGPKMPDEDIYKWNKTKIDIVLRNPKDDPVICEKVIEGFFKTMEIPNIGKGVAKQLVDAGYETIESVVALTVEDYLEIPGFKRVKSEKIYNAIQERLYSSGVPLTFADLPKLMAASNLMGRGISTKTIASILEMYPSILTSDDSAEEKIDMCTEVKGVQLKTCKPFVRNIPNFLKFVKDLNLEHVLDYTSQKLIAKATGDPHMMTGFRDKTLEDYLVANNIPIASTLSKKVKVLYVNEEGYSNSKTEKAQELGIPIIVYNGTQELEKTLKEMQIIN